MKHFFLFSYPFNANTGYHFKTSIKVLTEFHYSFLLVVQIGHISVNTLMIGQTPLVVHCRKTNIKFLTSIITL